MSQKGRWRETEECPRFLSGAVINTMTKGFIPSYRSQTVNEGSQAGVQTDTKAETMVLDAVAGFSAFFLTEPRTTYPLSTADWDSHINQ